MNAYESLAGAYDGLTRDIPYEKILDFIEAVLQKDGKRPETVLDKTTPRLIQFHTLKNAVNPPFLGGFSIFNTVVA